jgi:hypothetical protein
LLQVRGRKGRRGKEGREGGREERGRMEPIPIP